LITLGRPPGTPGWWPYPPNPFGNYPGPIAKFFSERREPVPIPWREPIPDPWREGPIPNPWRETPDPIPWAVAFLVSAVSSKVAAANMTNQTASQQFVTAAEQAITAFIDSDDICPRWPLPGPPPWLSVIASQLTLVANTLQAGALQTGILQVAGQVLDRVALGHEDTVPGGSTGHLNARPGTESGE
jgi:hypothetical protein